MDGEPRMATSTFTQLLSSANSNSSQLEKYFKKHGCALFFFFFCFFFFFHARITVNESFFPQTLLSHFCFCFPFFLRLGNSWILMAQQLHHLSTNFRQRSTTKTQSIKIPPMTKQTTKRIMKNSPLYAVSLRRSKHPSSPGIDREKARL